MPKKEGIQNMFDGIAADYDKLNHILSLNIDKIWRRKAVRCLVGDKPDAKVLDVACGTGDFTIAIAKKLNKDGEVTGIDISEEMMRVGREKIARLGINAELISGDCEDLPFADNTFDRISVGFGVRNFEHIDLGLAQMLRVLKPGGRLVILELSIPTNPFFKWCYKLYFLKILPAIGGLVSGSRGAYTYLPESVLHFPAPDKFAAMMRNAGFGNVKHKSLTLGICRMYIGKKC